MATTTTSTASGNKLTAQLLAAESIGIAGFVQERVHSTSIGVEATTAFLQQLAQELEDAADEYLPVGATTLEHAHEVELGSLLTAASLSIRYTTESEAMLPLLERFRNVFSDVLDFDSWTTPFLGLKAVALMASTRVLESFGSHVDEEDVEQELKKRLEIFVPSQENEHQWLMDLFAGPQDAELAVHKADYLLRPLCEYVSVASQTHESVNSIIYGMILPQLMTLVQRFGDEYAGDVRVADVTLNELATTIAVLLDAKMPRAASNVFALLRLPSFVDGVATSDGASPEDGIGEDEPESPIKFANGDSTIYQCVATLCGWLETPGRRTSASVVLVLLCQAIYLNDPEQNNTDTVATIIDSLVSCFRDLELKTLQDFEFVNALLEAFRDVTLRVPKLVENLASAIYNELRMVIARLESALKSSAIDEKELPAIKSACSKARHTLVEAFVAWIHNAGANSFAAEYLVDFLGETSTKLADPRVYGDVIHAVRKRAEVDSETDVAAVVDKAVSLLARALAQLDRYPKTTASHIVSAVTRVGSASGKFVAPYADDLATPLVTSIVSGSSKGKSLRARLEAVACVLVGSSQDESFQLGDHLWTSEYIGVLLENACSGSAHVLSILAGVVAASPQLVAQVATICASKSDIVGPVFNESLARWPLYEEDIDSVILTLEVLKALLSDSSFCGLLEPAKTASTIQTLAKNAASDDLDAVVTACNDVLAMEFLANVAAE